MAKISITSWLICPGPGLIVTIDSKLPGISGQVKLALSKLYRNKLAIAGQYIYFLEARKEYKKPGSSYDPSCNNISFFKGWILQNKRGDLKLIDKQFIFTDCDMKVAEVTKLLGILPIRDRIYIIIEDHGYEDESYSILELNGTRIKRAIKIYGGAC
ncbi:MAG: hypothetical protein L0226_01380 [Acidobacteria bacterium]|nr:hypothetical protein [Acidobacteriota bacterium]